MENEIPKDGTKKLIRKDGTVSKYLTNSCRYCGNFDDTTEKCCSPEFHPADCEILERPYY